MIFNLKDYYCYNYYVRECLEKYLQACKSSLGGVEDDTRKRRRRLRWSEQRCRPTSSYQSSMMQSPVLMILPGSLTRPKLAWILQIK